MATSSDETIGYEDIAPEEVIPTHFIYYVGKNYGRIKILELAQQLDGIMPKWLGEISDLLLSIITTNDSRLLWPRLLVIKKYVNNAHKFKNSFSPSWDKGINSRVECMLEYKDIYDHIKTDAEFTFKSDEFMMGLPKFEQIKNEIYERRDLYAANLLNIHKHLFEKTLALPRYNKSKFDKPKFDKLNEVIDVKWTNNTSEIAGDDNKIKIADMVMANMNSIVKKPISKWTTVQPGSTYSTVIEDIKNATLGGHEYTGGCESDGVFIMVIIVLILLLFSAVVKGRLFNIVAVVIISVLIYRWLNLRT